MPSGSGVVDAPKSISVKLVPPDRDVPAGNIVPVVIQVETTQPLRLVLRFEVAMFELVSPSEVLEVPRGVHELQWILYALPTASGTTTVSVRAYHEDHAVQAADMPVRII